MSDSILPTTQRAIELVGPGQLRLNRAKPVHRPGPHQLVCRVEAVGLCFSDLKLVQQFAAHPRKSEVISGLDQALLAGIPSYVPGDKPTVPGHEAVVRVAAVGKGVTAYHPGERYVVQVDYRWLPTAMAQATLGYNFEGALQEYVLFDTRVITAGEGECTLIPAPESLSASALALVEPWACVEHAYAERQRRGWKPGPILNVVEPEAPKDREAGSRRLSQAEDGVHDDIVYFGARAESVEQLFPKLAAGGLLVVVTRGNRFARRVSVPVGRVHYSGVRVVGTTGSDTGAALDLLPLTPEIRPGDRVSIVGAGGPMGAMHVVRILSAGIPGLQVSASDTDEVRLAALARLAAPLAKKRGIAFEAYHPTRAPILGPFDYIVLMVSAPELVAEAVEQAAEGAIINLFAGIPAEVSAAVDLNAYLEKRCCMVGTSGSEIQDMKTVLRKLEAGVLDTNLSVAAVGGLGAGIEGIRAIECREITGKIVLYPACRDLPLIRLSEMEARLPAVAAHLCEGVWTAQAESALLRVYQADIDER